MFRRQEMLRALAGDKAGLATARPAIVYFANNPMSREYSFPARIEREPGRSKSVTKKRSGIDRNRSAEGPP